MPCVLSNAISILSLIHGKFYSITDLLNYMASQLLKIKLLQEENPGTLTVLYVRHYMVRNIWLGTSIISIYQHFIVGKHHY